MAESLGEVSRWSVLHRAARWLAPNRALNWRYAGVDVSYRAGLDGGGTFLAQYFVRAVRRHYERLPVKSAFEWCSGPGFIGFSLLADGICEHLCLADINPGALDCVRRTVSRNRLQDRVSYYLSDNFKAIPDDEQFDLIVGNPPSYYSLNSSHPYYHGFQDDLRPNDARWHI